MQRGKLDGDRKPGDERCEDERRCYHYDVLQRVELVSKIHDLRKLLLQTKKNFEKMSLFKHF